MLAAGRRDDGDITAVFPNCLEKKLSISIGMIECGIPGDTTAGQQRENAADLQVPLSRSGRSRTLPHPDGGGHGGAKLLVSQTICVKQPDRLSRGHAAPAPRALLEGDNSADRDLQRF